MDPVKTVRNATTDGTDLKAHLVLMETPSVVEAEAVACVEVVEAEGVDVEVNGTLTGSLATIRRKFDRCFYMQDI